jgi:hypothetical protein
MSEAIKKKVLRKLELIQKLEKAHIAKFPTFRAFVDGGDSINLDEVNYLKCEQLVIIIKFCQENNCSFGIVSSENDREIKQGWMRVEIYPDHSCDALLFQSSREQEPQK